ncbi:unnamed protein product [Rotaria sp. Silwood1]|nr:unnamed protein product [Rotaria sp. Silwood1]
MNHTEQRKIKSINTERKITDFVDILEPSLRVPKANHLVIVAMDLPICENDRMHCVDTLNGLTKYFLGTLHILVESIEANAPVVIRKNRPKDYHPITTTAQRQHEIYLCGLDLKVFGLINGLVESDELKTSTLISDM